MLEGSPAPLRSSLFAGPPACEYLIETSVRSTKPYILRAPAGSEEEVALQREYSHVEIGGPTSLLDTGLFMLGKLEDVSPCGVLLAMKRWSTGLLRDVLVPAGDDTSGAVVSYEEDGDLGGHFQSKFLVILYEFAFFAWKLRRGGGFGNETR